MEKHNKTDFQNMKSHNNHEKIDDINHSKMNHEQHTKMEHEHKKEGEHRQHKHQSHHDHTAHHKMMMKDFKKRFIISLIVTVPILILSPLIQEFIGFDFTFTWSNYVLFILSSFIFLYGGWPFLKGLGSELKNKSPGMMTLIAVAISIAYFYSSAVVFGLEGKFFFWELATLIDI
ncbi:MAG: hypothetical protein BV457_04335, partial [Thermoplasmata archaeon M9B1D]